jgi:tRNA threonylcarbamoyladenosine biosynthesis protein TsaB
MSTETTAAPLPDDAAILAIDTSTPVCEICLYARSGVLAEDAWNSAGNQTVGAMPAVARMLAQVGLKPADLKGLVVGLGPGSFTGLRVGLSIAKGLALALNIPVAGIPSLDAIAYSCPDRRLPVVAALPAGRGRYCIGRYAWKNSEWVRSADFQVVPVDNIALDPAGRTAFCGEFSGADVERLQARFRDQAVLATPAFRFRRPAYLAELGWERLSRGWSDDPAALSPIYLQHTRGETP